PVVDAIGDGDVLLAAGDIVGARIAGEVRRPRARETALLLGAVDAAAPRALERRPGFRAGHGAEALALAADVGEGHAAGERAVAGRQRQVDRAGRGILR